MRPPYGNYNDLVRSASAIRNQSLVLWDFDSEDSVGASASQSEQLYDQLANNHPNNVIALNHETYQTTAEQVLPHAIQVLKAKGYTFATVAECLGLPAYHGSVTPGTKDVSSFVTHLPKQFTNLRNRALGYARLFKLASRSI